jgi:hypothetical protein
MKTAGMRERDLHAGGTFLSKKKHRPHGLIRKNSAPDAPSGTRTLDTLIKSQVLYQLS